jgi:hypothetical protein
MRKHAPLAAALEDVEDGVEDLAGAVDSWPPMFLGSRYMRFDGGPFIGREISWVRLSHTCKSSELLPDVPFSYSLRRRILGSSLARCRITVPDRPARKQSALITFNTKITHLGDAPTPPEEYAATVTWGRNLT